MKKYCLHAILQIILGIGLFAASTGSASSQNFAMHHVDLVQIEGTTASTQREAKLDLIECLKFIKVKYDINFSYEFKPESTPKLTKGQLQGLEVDKAIDLLAQNFNYKFEKINNSFYVIKEFPKVQEKQSPDKKEARKIFKILNLQKLNQPSLYKFSIPPVTVSGYVKDENGEPLIGVNVIVKGTMKGTFSDLNGYYELKNVLESAILEFTYISYISKEVNVDGRTSIDVQLEPDVTGLEEVIVVGYGTQKKSVLTGAISSLKGESLDNQQIGRVEQALQGRTSGVTIASNSGAPGSAATVRIRGITSLNDGASQPLYVVDGVIVGTGGIDYLNPSDIESIEVLKDAASAAIYGARSSAGVILITTKRGDSWRS